MKAFSNVRFSGYKEGHCQGIAVDSNREYIYLSFTTSLIKADLNGNIIGSVTGLVGHLGCIAFNSDDNKLYGTLEYKHDAVGKGIIKNNNVNLSFDDGFYLVCFDVEKINKIGLNAEKDGVMTAVYLDEVVNDYEYPGHKYGCSGIDGITVAPTVNGNDDRNYIYIAYGVYGDNKRNDNDYQIILCYDIDELSLCKLPLMQDNMHRSGPRFPLHKYFVFTGNTTYGIQNLEYDRMNNCMFACVYEGKKTDYPNFSLFAIDMSVDAEITTLKGINEIQTVLFLKDFSCFDKINDISGSYFSSGSTGIASLGNGNFLISEDFKDENGYGTEIFSYHFSDEEGFIKKEILL